MKAFKMVCSITIVIVVSMTMAYGQQTDSAKRRSVMYLTRYLKIDSVTAQQVNEARESYKAAVRQVMDNQALTAAQKREAIDILIDEKNKRLEQLLPEGQRQMIVPTTERRRGWRPDTTVRKTFK